MLAQLIGRFFVFMNLQCVLCWMLWAYKNRYDNYIDWNLADIKKPIEELEKRPMIMINTLLEITAIMISGCDIFENQNWKKEINK